MINVHNSSSTSLLLSNLVSELSDFRMSPICLHPSRCSWNFHFRKTFPTVSVLTPFITMLLDFFTFAHSSKFFHFDTTRRDVLNFVTFDVCCLRTCRSCQPSVPQHRCTSDARVVSTLPCLILSKSKIHRSAHKDHHTFFSNLVLNHVCQLSRCQIPCSSPSLKVTTNKLGLIFSRMRQPRGDLGSSRSIRLLRSATLHLRVLVVLPT